MRGEAAVPATALASRECWLVILGCDPTIQ